jgi:hypothetical protein
VTTVLSRRQFLAGTAAVGVGALAPGLASAGEESEFYAAIAFAGGSGAIGTAWGHPSQPAAEEAAVQASGDNAARPVVWARNAWAALGVGARRGSGWAWAATAGGAIDNALTAARRADDGVYLAAVVHASPLGSIGYDHSDIPDDFNRRQILANAMNLLHFRFRDMRVPHNAYGVLQGGSFLEGGVMEAHGINDNETNRNNLLWHQLEQLRLAGAKFPNVVFKAADLGEEPWASARLGLVTARDPENIAGSFEMNINLRVIGGGGERSDVTAWASVIAHEMLHNLGHKHEPGNYTDNRQINVFQHAVYHNGAYRNGLMCPGFACTRAG